MYEFLAPWGALVPAISATLIYLIVSEIRRKQMLSAIHAPDDTGPGFEPLPAVSRLA